MLSRNNHHISQMVLDGWSTNKEVYVYDLLVAHQNVPIWRKSNIKGVASYDSMFVRLLGGVETDDLEKWFSVEYETPAKDALVRARNGEDLSEDDWYHLIELIACHIVRSPSFIIKTLEVARNTSGNVLKEIEEDVEKLSKNNIDYNKSSGTQFSLFPLQVTKNEKEETVEVETMIGKQFYLWYMKYCLENNCKLFHQYKWGVITGSKKVSFPITDNPVVFLNYYGNGEYDLDGKWNSPNTNILFPISSNKILYCQVGNNDITNINVTKKMSHVLKRAIVENAYKSVISNSMDSTIPKIMPREVNLELFQEEKAKWPTFQKNYLEKEYKYIK